MKHTKDRAKGCRIREALDRGFSKTPSFKNSHFASILSTTFSSFASCYLSLPNIDQTRLIFSAPISRLLEKTTEPCSLVPMSDFQS